MPRIPNYTDDAGVQLNLPLIDGVASRVSNDTARLGLQMAERRGNDWLRVSELANAIAIRRQAQRNSAEVSNAIAQATMQMDEIRNTQLDRKGLDAEGRPATEDMGEVLSAVDAYSQNVSSVQEKIRNNLLNDVQKQKFDEWYRSRYTSDMDTVARHQQQQLDLATENGTVALLNSAHDSAFSSMLRGDYDTAENIFSSNLPVYGTTKAMQGQPEEYIKQQYNNTVFATIKDATDSLTKDGKSADAQALVQRFGGYLTAKQKDELRGIVAPAVAKTQAKDFVKSVVSYNPDGTINLAAARNAIHAQAAARGSVEGFDFSGMTERQQEVFNAALAEAQRRGYANPTLALAHLIIETGWDVDSAAANANNFGGISTDTPTKLKRPENEGGYYVDYTEAGVQGGMSALFDLLDRYGLKDAKTIDEWDEKLMNNPDAPGKYYAEYNPDTGEYARPGRRNTHRGVVDILTSNYGVKGQGRPDEKFEKEALAALDELYRDNQIQLQQRAKERNETLLRDIASGGIVTMSDAYKWVEKNCTSEMEKVSSIHTFKDAKGLLDAADKEQEQLALTKAFEDIAAGKITSADELNNYPISQKGKDAIKKAYFNQAMSWAKLPGVDGLLSDASKQMAPSDFQGQAKFVLMEAVSNDIQERQRNNPTYVPGQWEVMSIIKKQASNIMVKQKEGDYLFWQSEYETKYPRAALVALGDGAEPIDDVRVRDKNGIVWVYDAKAQNFMIEE